MTSAMIRLSQRREKGRKVVEVALPRRILTALRSMNPKTVRFKFGINEEFELDAGDLQEAVVETYKKKRQAEAEAERMAVRRRRQEAAAEQARKAAEEAEAEKRRRKGEVE